MNEFIEKLIGRFEELGWVFADYYPDGTEIHKVRKKSVAYDDVISIVNELAEECKPIINYNTLLNDIKSQLKQFIADSNNIDYNRALVEAIEVIDKKAEEHQGGWISCSERLPETNESVLCWAKSTARGGDVCFVGSCHNGFWFLQSSADTHSFPGQYVIVAWQPLPDPYKGE